MKLAFRDLWAGFVPAIVCAGAGYSGYLWAEDTMGREGISVVLASSSALLVALVFLTREVSSKLDKLIDTADKFEVESYVAPVYRFVSGIRHRLTSRYAAAVIAGMLNGGLAIAIAKVDNAHPAAASFMTALGFGAYALIVLYAIRVVGLYLHLDDFRLDVRQAVENERQRSLALLELNPSKLKHFPEKPALAGPAK